MQSVGKRGGKGEGGGEERGEGEEGGERAPICSLLAFTKQGISGAIWTQIELVLGQMKALDVGNTLRVSNLQGTAKLAILTLLAHPSTRFYTCPAGRDR